MCVLALLYINCAAELRPFPRNAARAFVQAGRALRCDVGRAVRVRRVVPGGPVQLARGRQAPPREGAAAGVPAARARVP